MTRVANEDIVNNIIQYADEYIQLCLNSTKEVATGSGKIVKVKERHIPTINYFLTIWLPTNKGNTIARRTYYNWLNNTEGIEKMQLITTIDDKFKALAGDIVANEGKGIFYAKNKLGWTDKYDTTVIKEQPLFDNIPQRITIDVSKNHSNQQNLISD